MSSILNCLNHHHVGPHCGFTFLEPLDAVQTGQRFRALVKVGPKVGPTLLKAWPSFYFEVQNTVPTSQLSYYYS